MSEYQPIKTKAELDLLDEQEMVSGYLHGLHCPDEPGSDKSRSFWHGWRNAQVDRGRVAIDDAQMMLAREIVGQYNGLN